MDKNATLDEIFARARAEQPVMTREESWQVVRSSSPSSSARTSSPERWKTFLGMVAILAGAAIWLVWPQQQNEPVQSRRKTIPSRTNPVPVFTTEESAPSRERIGIDTQTTINNPNSRPSHSSRNGDISPKASVPSLASGNPTITSNTNTDVKEMRGIGMIDPPLWLLDSLDIRVTDSGRVYYDPSPIDDERALVFQLPAADMPLTIPLAEAPHISPWPIRMQKWSRMITDDRGKVVARKMMSGRDVAPDYSDVLLRQQLQDTAKLSRQEVDELLRKVDSARSARGIISYERMFDINRMIPIRISVPNHSTFQTNWYPSSYYVFWYEPTPEFLSVLPDVTLAHIRAELTKAILALPDTGYIRRWNEKYVIALQTSVDSVLTLHRQNGQIMPSGIVEPPPGTGFLTVGQTSSGALSITALAPNPNKGESRLHYILREPRDIDISLYDIHGRPLRSISQRLRQAEGEHESEINVMTIPPGIYLLVLSSNKGERAVQRLIIDR